MSRNAFDLSAAVAAGRRPARWMAYLGLACGVLYSFGGLAYDLATTGLNLGTALAFMALVGMPAISGAVGFALGVLGWTVSRRWRR